VGGEGGGISAKVQITAALHFLVLSNLQSPLVHTLCVPLKTLDEPLKTRYSLVRQVQLGSERFHTRYS